MIGSELSLDQNWYLVTVKVIDKELNTLFDEFTYKIAAITKFEIEDYKSHQGYSNGKYNFELVKIEELAPVTQEDINKQKKLGESIGRLMEDCRLD